jgi:hypothetical protein
MSRRHDRTSIEREGWVLVSAEERHAANPETFLIPSVEKRAALVPGDAAHLLFDIQTLEAGKILDRGVDRMWVIVKSRVGDRYLGVLDSDPGRADGLLLEPGDEIVFGPEHVAKLDRPPREFVIEKYGKAFFD